MSLREEVESFKARMRADPAHPAPVLRVKRLTPAVVRDWKQSSRAYDLARLELRLTTPAKVQRANSAFGQHRAKHPRIVSYRLHA